MARYESVKRGDEDILRQRITELVCNYDWLATGESPHYFEPKLRNLVHAKTRAQKLIDILRGIAIVGSHGFQFDSNI